MATNCYVISMTVEYCSRPRISSLFSYHSMIALLFALFLVHQSAACLSSPGLDPPTYIALCDSVAVQGNVSSTTNRFYYIVTSGSTGVIDVALTAFSGDPDLFISWNPAVTMPDWVAYNDFSIAEGGDAISVAVSPNIPVVYIGVVYSGYASAFSLIATFTSNATGSATPNVVQVVAGESILLSVAASAWSYYKFTLATANSAVVFSLFKRSGNPDLYINVRQDDVQLLPTLDAYDYRAVTYQDDIISISNAAAGTYYIGVYGASSSVYVLSLNVNGQATQLVESTPITASLPAGQTGYFYVTVPDATRAMTVAVTAISGDPDLYIDPVQQTPNITARYIAQSYLSDTITIQPPLVSSAYYIAVNAFTACRFTIALTFSRSAQVLQAGLPQLDNVGLGQTLLYRVYVPGATAMTITATPFSGQIRLYVGNTNDTGANSYLWQSSVGPTPTVYVTDSDPSLCRSSSCSYYINVVGVSASYYSLTVSTADTTTTLSDGVAVNGQLAAGAFDFYRYVNNKQFAVIFISLTAQSGDTDLFVSSAPFSPTNRPTVANSNFSSTASGGDTIVIDPTKSPYLYGPTTPYYIAVLSASVSTNATTATYSLQVSAVDVLQGSTVDRDSRFRLLTIGQPLVGFVVSAAQALGNTSFSNVQYFIFNADDDTQEYTITLTPRYGDPDLYVIAIDATKMTNASLPGPASANQSLQFRSQLYGPDSLVLTGANSCSARGFSNGNCRYIIAVAAFHTSFFTLTATSLSSTRYNLLLDGQQTFVSIPAGAYRYFLFLCPPRQDVLTISVTALTGDPDVYAYYNPVALLESLVLPNTTVWTNRSISYGTDLINLSPGCPNYNASTPGAWTIAVYGYSNSSAYVMATLGAITLSAGVPVQDAINYGDYRLYVFSYLPSSLSAQANALSFTVRPTYGSVDMFVSISSYPDPTVCLSRAWNTSAVASCYAALATDVVPNVIQLSATQLSNSSAQTKYYLRVQSPRGRANYDVIVTYSSITSQPTILASGRQIIDSVAINSYQYYRVFITDRTSDLQIDATTFFGNIEVFLGTNPLVPFVNASTYNMTSGQDPTTSNSLILYPVTDSTPSVVFISVKGWLSSKYTLLVSNSAIVLVSGQASPFQTRNLNTPLILVTFTYDDVASLVINYPASIGGSVGVSSAGITFNLYVCSDQCNNTYLPGPTAMLDSNNQKFISNVTIGSTVTLPFTQASSSLMYIAVYASIANVAVTALLSTQDTSDALSNYARFVDTITPGVPSRNLTLEVDQSTQVYINFQQCVGTGNVYVSQTYSNPSAQQYQWTMSRTNPLIRISVGDPQRADYSPVFFLSVVPSNNAAIFTYELASWNELQQQYQPTVPAAPQYQYNANTKTVTVNAKWAPCENCANVQYAYVAYVYTAADQLQYNTFSLCGLQQLPSAQIIQMTSVPSGPALTLNPPADPFFVTVVASTNSETAGGGSFASTLYPEITVNINAGGGGGGGSGGGGGGSDTAALLAGILVPLILILLCVIGVLAYRNRQMARTISFELGGSLSSLPGLLLEKARRGPPSVRTSRASRDNYGNILMRTRNAPASDDLDMNFDTNEKVAGLYQDDDGGNDTHVLDDLAAQAMDEEHSQGSNSANEHAYTNAH